MAPKLEIIPISHSHRLKSLGGPAKVAYELQDFRKRHLFSDSFTNRRAGEKIP